MAQGGRDSQWTHVLRGATADPLRRLGHARMWAQEARGAAQASGQGAEAPMGGHDVGKKLSHPRG